MGRGRLIRSPLLTFGSLRAPGVECEWTFDGVPAGDRPGVIGQRVELHATLEPAAGAITASTPIAFDVHRGTPGTGTPLLRLTGTGATAPAGTPSDARTTVFRELAEDEDFARARADFVSAHAADLATQLLAAREHGPSGRTHLITWWAVPSTAAGELHFAVEAGTARGVTTQPLRISAAPGGTRPVSLALRYEDGSPMVNAEVEVAFGGGVVQRARSDGQGVATVEVPAGAPEVFRVFLLSYEQRFTTPGGGTGPGVIPGITDTRPEVVAAFAFDSSFPGPAVFANLRRVRAKVASSARDSRLIVFGHTDRVGSAEYNLSLSDRRAQTVLALLLDDRDMFESVAAHEAWDTAHHQSMLRGLGCNPGAIDGQVGAMTRAATTNFQREHNLGVYHDRAAVPRDRPTLPEDGNLSPATRAAIRDSYVAVAPHLRPGQFTEPPFAGCGKAHHVSDRDSDNRRAVVAFLPADTDLSQSAPCDRYPELVGETPEDRRGPHFSDHQWLEEESGALHLSAATPIPDRTPARIQVVRCEGPVPMPPPDGSGGGEPPTLGPQLADLPAEIRGGVCYARWTSPPADTLDSSAWMVNHDARVEIVEPGDHEPLGPDDPASGTALLGADGLHPPMFVLRAGEAWGVGGPPGARLERLRLGPATDDPDSVSSGVAVRTDGSLQPFLIDRGLVEVERTGDVIAVAVTEHSSAPGAEGVA